MSKYRIVFDGNTYEMDVERIDTVTVVSDKPSARAGDRASKLGAANPNAQVIDSSTSKKEINNSNVVTSPMPGTIVKLLAKNGDSVRKGQVVLVLEAMKMENEIAATRDGIVTGLQVGESAIVQGGTVLFEILD